MRADVRHRTATTRFGEQAAQKHPDPIVAISQCKRAGRVRPALLDVTCRAEGPAVLVVDLDAAAAESLDLTVVTDVGLAPCLILRPDADAEGVRFAIPGPDHKLERALVVGRAHTLELGIVAAVTTSQS